MTGKKTTRPYQMRRRAELQELTRLRITEAAVALHGTLGPARTSISAVAAHAGVRRSTVYRHFPDEAALFDACSAHWAAANPLPALDAWAEVKSPDERLEMALSELYAFYRQTEQMLEKMFRDETLVPAVGERFSSLHDYIASARDTLMRGRKLPAQRRKLTRAAVAHALSYHTWKSLAREQRLSDVEAVALMRKLVDAAS